MSRQVAHVERDGHRPQLVVHGIRVPLGSGMRVDELSALVSAINAGASPEPLPAATRLARTLAAARRRMTELDAGLQDNPDDPDGDLSAAELSAWTSLAEAIERRLDRMQARSA